MDLSNVFGGKKVWISGLTGFKGSWMTECLLFLGAHVTGFGLAPEGSYSLFQQLDLTNRISYTTGDINDYIAVRQSIDENRPDFVFHLAAQPLVRLSYFEPAETFHTNVMGTMHVLEALRKLGRACTAVIITSDKCYLNRETPLAYREDDPLGGYDPYSASKAAAEIIVASYRNSFFNVDPITIRVASARAANVIGGGDWALHRIVPDAIRSLQLNQPVQVRNPSSTRTWQHVLESISGYLELARCLSQVPNNCSLQKLDTFNFSTGPEANRSVAELVDEILIHWPGSWQHTPAPGDVHEATLLDLASNKAGKQLGWTARWNFRTTVKKTVDWYRQITVKPSSARAITLEQIQTYFRVT